MRKTDAIIILGSLMAVIAAAIGNVYWPVFTYKHVPSDQFRSIKQMEDSGFHLYLANGCTYCHSQYIRPQDWGEGAERIAKTGDYYDQTPHQLGSERTGPDLSQEGGEHPDDWQRAHFMNPRWTSPRSLMPRFAYLGGNDIDRLIAYAQSLGRKNADARVAVQKRFKGEAIAAFRKGPDANIVWLHSRVPPAWRAMKSESVASDASVARGEKIYTDYCIGCHGPVGDGDGPAAQYLYPPPLNFTTLKRHLIDGQYIGGILYYQIMNGITGTAMPYFKKHLESAKIWDVGNFVAVNYINYSDDQVTDVGIPPAYEGQEAAPTTPTPQPGGRPPAVESVR